MQPHNGERSRWRSLKPRVVPNWSWTIPVGCPMLRRAMRYGYWRSTKRHCKQRTKQCSEPNARMSTFASKQETRPTRQNSAYRSGATHAENTVTCTNRSLKLAPATTKKDLNGEGGKNKPTGKPPATHAIDGSHIRLHGPERKSAAENSTEPAPKSVELDLGM